MSELQVGDLVNIAIRRARIGHEAGPGWLNFFIDGTPHRVMVAKTGVTVERVAPAEETEIPVEVAAHVLFHFGQGGWPPSGFKSTLLLLIATADVVNRTTIALAFPAYVAAFNLAQLTDDGTAKLQAIVARDGE